MPENTVTLYDAAGNPFEVEQTQTEPPNIRQMREKIKDLEEKAAAADALQAKIDTMERSNALRDAGLALDDDRMAALQAVHKGDWTPDTVRETAVKLGWAEPKQAANADEQAAHARLAAAQTGGGTAPPNPEAELDAKIAAAKSPEELMAIYRTSGRLVAQ